MAKLTISIINYNSGGYLINCLESLKNIENELEMEVWVVDNNSSDDSLIKAQTKFPKWNFIKNSDNLGFGKANNQVIEKTRGEYILFLNPDTEVKKGVLKTLVNFMDSNENTGAVTCKVLLDNNHLDWATHRGFPAPLASLLYFLGSDKLYHLSDRNLDEIHEVDAISGAFFLTRKKVLDKVGGFDEEYFMYAEDIDLCFRIKRAGYKIIYYPQVSIIHHKGISSGLKKHSQQNSTASNETKLRSINAFYQTMKIFYRKHYAKNNLFLVNWLIYFGINLKWSLAKRKLMV